jgi:hypothetical protein
VSAKFFGHDAATREDLKVISLLEEAIKREQSIGSNSPIDARTRGTRNSDRDW